MPGLLDLGSFLWAIVALGLVLALIWGGQALLVARRGAAGDRRGRRLHLAETIALDGKRRLHLVQCDGRCLLLQTGGTQDLMLGWLHEPPAGDP